MRSGLSSAPACGLQPAAPGMENTGVPNTAQRDLNRRRNMHSHPASHPSPSLADSDARYRASFDQAAVGILHTSLQNRIITCNESFARIVGYTPEELAGSDFQAITPPEDQSPSRAVAQRLLSGASKTETFEKRYRRKDGTITWAMLTISIQRDASGQPLFFLAVVQDINSRKQTEQLLAAAQEALRISEARYRTAFQMSLDGIVLSRVSDGMYVDVNTALLEATGYTRDEVVGRTSADLNIWADPRERAAFLDLLRRDSECRNFEARFRRKDGKLVWGLMSASIIELEGELCILSLTRDISEVKSAADEIRHLAYYDPLTGLPNRRLLLDRLQQTLSSSRRSRRKRALLFIDLDNFKTLNDTLGHSVGDLLLEEVAHRLKSCIRASDTAARLGGDEFVVMLDDLSGIAEEAASQAKIVAEKILDTTSRPYELAGRECLSTSSIGITIFGDHHETSGEILQQADIAMYQAKAAGRDTFRFFAPGLQTAVNARAALEDEMRQGIRNHQFVLWYQPQVTRGAVIGAEALLRWNHPSRGLLPPASFISLAEETGLILPLGNFVLDAACHQAADWARQPGALPFSVAVNVSARQFRQVDFVEQVLAALDRSQLDPRSLKLEITESLFLDNFEATIAIMRDLKSYGVQFSLDDFGTGYSSLAYLKRLPLDQLKIDRGFVRDMLADPASSAIAQTIVSLSHAMDLSLVAEGVETEEQRVRLADLGCHTYQGFLFSPAVPADEFLRLLPSLITP